MSDGVLTELTVVFGWRDLDCVEKGTAYAGEADAGELDESDDTEALEAWRMELNLEPLAPDRFRLPEPVSVRFAGPHGPMLNLGEIIEAIRDSEGAYRYKRTVESRPIWSRVFGGVRSLEELHADPVAQVLEELERLGCRWEWCVGNLTIQALGPASEGPGQEAMALLEQLVTRLRNPGS